MDGGCFQIINPHARRRNNMKQIKTKPEIVYKPFEWFNIKDDSELRKLNLPLCAVCKHPIVLVWDLPEKEKEKRIKTLHKFLKKHGFDPYLYEDFFILTGGTEDDKLAHEYCLTR